MRMFSAKGNPQANNLFEIIAYLSEKKEMPGVFHRKVACRQN